MLSSQAAVVVALALACLAAPAQAISWPSFSKKSRTMQETDRACAPSTDPDYVCTLDLADGITFHYAVDATNLYGKMDAVSNAPVYLGFGVSPTGGMVGSDAIIGVPDAGVFRYTLGGKNPDLVKKVATQDLTGTAATFDTATGVTSMTFTRPLEAARDTIAVPAAGTVNFIWAHGSSAEIGYHGKENHWQGTVDTTTAQRAAAAPGAAATDAPVDGTSTDAPTAAPTSAPTAAPTSA